VEIVRKPIRSIYVGTEGVVVVTPEGQEETIIQTKEDITVFVVTPEWKADINAIVFERPRVIKNIDRIGKTIMIEVM